MKTENLTKFLFASLLVALLIQSNLGLADNGDFTRSMKWITSGPIGIEPNWPNYGTEEWSQRFFKYWIPFWKLEWQWSEVGTRPISSALFLWIPGALLNFLFFSRKILYLPILTIPARMILLSIFLLLFKWSNAYPRYSKILLFSFVTPIAFLPLTTDYLSYLNSFYLESASLIFVLLFFASTLILQQRSSNIYFIWTLVSLFLLATVKPAYFYWPMVSVPFILYRWFHEKRYKTYVVAFINLLFIVLFTATSVFITKAGSVPVNSYHSLFYGVLTFSNNPIRHLQELGINGGEQCVNIGAYASGGDICFNKYQNQMTFKNTVIVIYKEPFVIIKSLKYVFDNMQQISLSYLGKYSFDDPRSNMPSPASSISASNVLNFWSNLKLRFLPKGYTLGLVLLGFMIWFTLNLKTHVENIHKDLAFVGAIFTIACIVDMVVAILGDGKAEIIKHLFLANILFDLVFIVFTNSVLIYCIDIGKNLLSNFGKPRV